jgi:pyridoxamine 5'-phosphate oxidase-like protein
MRVIATTGDDGALATPVRFYHLDFALTFTAAAGSPKLRNIEKHPRVSIGVFAPMVGQASSRGAQIFGLATVLMPSNPRFDHYWPGYRCQSDYVERSRSLDEPHAGPLVVVEADRIVYTEHWLRRDGYAPRQFWKRHIPNE